MPYRACVFQHGSDYTHVHSKQIALSDTSALQLVNSKNTLPSLRYNRINMGHGTQHCHSNVAVGPIAETPSSLGNWYPGKFTKLSLKRLNFLLQLNPLNLAILYYYN